MYHILYICEVHNILPISGENKLYVLYKILLLFYFLTQ